MGGDHTCDEFFHFANSKSYLRNQPSYCRENQEYYALTIRPEVVLMVKTMIRSCLAFALFVAGSVSLSAEAEKPLSIDDRATHSQAAVISIQDSDNPLKLNAFTLNTAGRIVAACGPGPGEIRIVKDDGVIVDSWAVDVKPEAVQVCHDRTILVGGGGQLFRFSATGEVLATAESPHALLLRDSGDSLREQAIALIKRRAGGLGSRIEAYEQIIALLEAKAEKGKLNEQEKKMLPVFVETLERFRKLAEETPDDDEPKEPSEEQIQEHITNITRRKMRISSICSSGDHVFIATPSGSGHGYVVWKMNPDFSAGEMIVEDLSGCCGQMNVQCHAGSLYVAENSRHRVVRYDLKGNKTNRWGERDRTGIDGFSGCCNPMNVCFGESNDVFTAESGIGRIKRYRPNGEVAAFIGDVDLVPGCKNVSIAVSPDNDSVYVLDLTRNRIVLMQPKSPGTEVADSTTAERE